MKTTLAFSVIAALCMPAPTVQATSETTSFSVSAAIQEDGNTAMLIGAGRIKAKNGNTFTIHSDDGNDYFAEVVGSYIVGDYVYHSDPVNGWVEILGHAD
ncbi:MAG TPA: hypothetical protein VI603_08875 [Saprospiraceae bacterium]|nr:hypothetical protein [Saprospiraceae bacterium]